MFPDGPNGFIGKQDWFFQILIRRKAKCRANLMFQHTLDIDQQNCVLQETKRRSIMAT